jgi:hypothetical protein
VIQSMPWPRRPRPWQPLHPRQPRCISCCPQTHSTQSGTSRGAAAQLGTAAQVDTTTPVSAPADLVPATPPIPVPTPVGVGFTANLANNPFAALAPPLPVCHPNAFSYSIPSETLDSDFTYAFAAIRSIVTPSNHSKQSVIGYIGTACQVVMYPKNLPTIQYTCLSTAK